MAVKIRLARIGKKKVPFFRIVAIDSRKKRDGEFLQDLGTYDVLKGNLISYKKEAIDKWIAQGAIPTASARKLMKLYAQTGAARAESETKAAAQ